jgi:hypothetical protein
MKPQRRYEDVAGGWTKMHIRCKCDCCSNYIEFEGDEKDVQSRWRVKGGTVGSTGIYRCQECSQSYAYNVNKALRRIA